MSSRRSNVKAFYIWVGSNTTPNVLTVTGKPVMLRAPVNVADRMSELEAKRLWPWSFRVALVVRPTGLKERLLVRERELPIIPGD